MPNSYDNNSIKSLSDRDAVRLRPANILGSDDINGCFHCLVEIVDNSIDEVKGGHGDRVVITRHKYGFYSVRDYGRGVPMDWNENEGKYNYELVFLTLYSGGKYTKDDESSYMFSKGLNGLGASASALSSRSMHITSYRDGYKYEIYLDKGIPVGELKKLKLEKKDNHTGTYIKWMPDSDVFTDVDIPIDWIKKYAKEQAIVNKKTLMVVVDEIEDKKYEYYYENGIIDYMDEVNLNKNITDIVYLETDAKGRDRDDRKEYKSKYEIAFTFNNNVNLLESYHNSSFLKHGGSPHDAVKLAFTYSIDKLIKQLDGYNKNEKKITFDDIKDSLVIVTNTYSTETSYQNQTKFAITNKFIKDFMNDYLREQLEIYFVENPIDAEKIANQVLVNKRAREKAEQTRLNVTKRLQGTINNTTSRIDGFINCRSKDKSKNELFVVEGKSALGSTKQGRNAETQAIYALRGKILNCLKADYNTIFKNDVIVDLIKILGCGVEMKSKHNKNMSTFNIDDLKWDKVIICTDQDVDGNHIRTLILTAIYKLMPTLIEEGKIYIAESPLYEIENGGKSYFAYTDKEKDNIISNLKGKSTVQRSKGLGENSAEMMWETTMNPKSRKLIQVLPEDIEKTQKYFEMFLGDDLDGRKKYIENNLHKYIDEALD